MRLSHLSYQKYIEKLNVEINGEPLHSPLLLNNHTLVFPFMEKQHQALVISLNPKFPIMFRTTSDLFFSSFDNSFLQKFRKHIGKTQAHSIELDPNDFVIEFNVRSLDFGDEYTLILELIPTKPNLVVLDDKNCIKQVFNKAKNRDLKYGEKYLSIGNEKLIDGEQEITNEFLSEIFAQETQIREKEKFATFEKYLTSKIKAIKRKINAIENDVKIAAKCLEYQTFADEILTLGLNLKSHKSELELSQGNIKLDDSKTILENVESFYKKSKKAKETISRSETNILNAQNEIKMYEDIYSSFRAGNEREKEKIASLYTLDKKKKETVATEINRPWKINLNGTIIYFGRNASQNDYLSFAMKLDREFTWMHIKDKSGAHLIIANKKPTENELITASEISLLCSRATTGEISYTKKKNVRRGHVLGEAILKNYSVIKINSIRKETIKLFDTAVRCN